MLRKTKEQKELEKKEKIIKKTEPIKNSTTSKKSTTTKKTSTTKKSSSAKKTSITKKVSTASKSSTSKKSAVEKKSSTTKKTPTKKIANEKKKVEIVEYYDLPYRYNQTVVKLLAQTPTTLFIYWDISDKDRENFKKQYGENFFENTKPILIVHNNTLGYSFEIEINDFANSWYLHIADSKCDYKIELGRRPILKTEKLNIDYVYITTSNEIESPNNRILFDKNQKLVYFKNVKTGSMTSKSITSSAFIKSMSNIYNIYDLYKKLYGNENIEEFYDLTNPSSGNPSSGSLSSKFK